TIEEEGVEFQSHIDGGLRTITPESSMDIQWALGADIAMAFDHVVPAKADRASAEEGMERTLRWLDRCRRRHEELVNGRGSWVVDPAADDSTQRPRITPQDPRLTSSTPTLSHITQ